MYKAFTSNDFIKMFKLPIDYKIDGLLTYGAWDVKKHNINLNNTLQKLNANFSIKKLEGFLSDVSEINIDNKKYWFAVMYGSTHLSEIVHLACLFGSKRNIHIGSCGGLFSEINDMELVLPTWSYGNESTTRIYEPQAKDFKHYANDLLKKELKNNLKNKHKLWEGPIITTQAMMGETWEDIKSWSKDGFYGVEMETSTVFSVSNHFNIPSAALVYVSDNLIKGQVVGDDSHTMQKEKREVVKMDVYEVAINTLIN